jgi:hypothetical protein
MGEPSHTHYSLSQDMVTIREVSKEILRSHDILLDRYRLQLVAAITMLSDSELRTLARLISEGNFDPLDSH